MGIPVLPSPPVFLMDEKMGRLWEGASWPDLPQYGRFSLRLSLPLTPGPLLSTPWGPVFLEAAFLEPECCGIVPGSLEKPQSWTPKFPGQRPQDLILCRVG